MYEELMQASQDDNDAKEEQKKWHLKDLDGYRRKSVAPVHEVLEKLNIPRDVAEIVVGYWFRDCLRLLSDTKCGQFPLQLFEGAWERGITLLDRNRCRSAGVEGTWELKDKSCINSNPFLDEVPPIFQVGHVIEVCRFNFPECEEQELTGFFALAIGEEKSKHKDTVTSVRVALPTAQINTIIAKFEKCQSWITHFQSSSSSSSPSPSPSSPSPNTLPVSLVDNPKIASTVFEAGNQKDSTWTYFFYDCDGHPNYCFAPSCEILMGDGTFRSVECLMPGNVVATRRSHGSLQCTTSQCECGLGTCSDDGTNQVISGWSGSVDTVQARVVEEVGRKIDMVQLGSRCLVTPGHPVRAPDDCWVKPRSILPTTRVTLPRLYNFVLVQRGSLFLRTLHSSQTDTQAGACVEVSTVGQYCDGLDTPQSFFGSERAVLALESRQDWPNVHKLTTRR